MPRKPVVGGKARERLFHRLAGTGTTTEKKEEEKIVNNAPMHYTVLRVKLNEQHSCSLSQQWDC